MSGLVKAFWTEPIFCLGILSVTATTLVSEEVITGWVGVLAVAILTAAQRQLVKPR